MLDQDHRYGIRKYVVGASLHMWTISLSVGNPRFNYTDCHAMALDCMQISSNLDYEMLPDLDLT